MKKSINSKFPAALLAAVIALFSLPLHAAVFLDKTTDFTVVGDGGTSVSTSSFTVADNPDRMLVLTLSTRKIQSGIDSVMFGDQSFTQASVSNFSSSKDYAIFYLLNPDAETNSITVTANAAIESDAGIAGGIISLQNVLQVTPISSSYSEDNVADPATFTLSYNLVPGGNYVFVEGSAANNGGGRMIGSPPAGFNTLLNADSPGGLGMTAFSGYQDGGQLSGNVDRLFETAGNNSQRTAGGLAIAYIPEPSAATLLLGSAGILLLLRRRRA